jgi:hypothetical protein
MDQWYDSLVQVASQERKIPGTDGLAVFFQRTAGFIVAFQMPLIPTYQSARTEA